MMQRCATYECDADADETFSFYRGVVRDVVCVTEKIKKK
jgi:hypothetical protein